MKKNLVGCLLLLSISSAVWAQKKGDVEFGVNLGFNNSSVASHRERSDASSGFNFGGSMDYYFSDRWSLKGKLIYDQKGWDHDVIQDLDTGTYYPTNYDVNYLTIPVMANWHFGKKRNWYLDFGPYMGFLLSAHDTSFNTDVSSAFNSTDFGLALGIGVKIPVSDKIKIFIEFDGQGGSTNIIKNNPYSDVTTSRSSINFGMNFLLK